MSVSEKEVTVALLAHAPPWLPWLAFGLVAGAAGVVPMWSLAPWSMATWVIAVGALLSAGLAVGMAQKYPLAARCCLGLAALLAGGWMAPLPDRTATGPRLLAVTGIVTTVSWQGYDQGFSLRPTTSDDPTGYVPARLFVRAPGLPGVRSGDQVTARGAWTRDTRGDALKAVELSLVIPREHSARGFAWAALARLHTHRELAEALLLGQGSPPEKALFRATGLLHVLAVSGVHLAIAAAMGMWLLLRCGVPWWWRQIAVIGLIVGYTWLTAGSPATVRALAMGLAVVAYALTAREAHRLGPVALATLMLVLVDPTIARDVGFQLSLVAVLGIVTLGMDLVAWRERVMPCAAWPLDRLSWRALLLMIRTTSDGLVIGIAATLATAPVLALQFGTLAPWSPIGTLLATPPTTVALWSGLPLIGLAGIWPNGPWEGLYLIVEYSLKALVSAVQCAALLPGQMAVNAPPPWIIFLWPLMFLPLDRLVRVAPSARRTLTRVAIALVLIVGWWISG